MKVSLSLNSLEPQDTHRLMTNMIKQDIRYPEEASYLMLSITMAPMDSVSTEFPTTYVLVPNECPQWHNYRHRKLLGHSV